MCLDTINTLSVWLLSESMFNLIDPLDLIISLTAPSIIFPEVVISPVKVAVLSAANFNTCVLDYH